MCPSLHPSACSTAVSVQMGLGVGFTLGKKEADGWFEPERKYGRCFLVPLRTVLCERGVDVVEGFAWGNLAHLAGGHIASGDKHLWDCSQSQGAQVWVIPAPCPALGGDGGAPPLTALLTAAPDVLVGGSAVSGTRSVPWAVQESRVCAAVCRQSCCALWYVRQVCAPQSAPVSYGCSNWPQKYAWGLPWAGSLFTQAILSLTEIKPPSHTLGSSQSSWEIKAERGWLLPAEPRRVSWKGLWEASSAIALTGVSGAFSTSRRQSSQMCLQSALAL